MKENVKAWHFVADTLRDGRSIPADGVKLIHIGPIVMCEAGLHASLRPSEALNYAPGATLCLVECGGLIKIGHDKLVCSERTIIARMDATELLRYFARQQALSVVHLCDPPDVVIDYLMGDDSAMDAARAAAWAAARAAARAAAGDAAGDAAWDAARAAAMDDFDNLVYNAFEDWL